MNRRQRFVLLRTLLFLFVLNLISLALYFALHPQHPQTQPETPKTLTLNPHQQNSSHSLKPWPHLPSFLPWTPSSAQSCDAYFGHGFTRRTDLVGNGGGGFFRCFYSEALRSSVCEGGRMRMDPEKIRMSRGGEEIEKVMGRGEEEELPRFEEGAFVVEGASGGRVFDEKVLDEYLPVGVIRYHSMRALMENLRVVGSGEMECSQWIHEPTIVVTRFEYANLFHTVTDWYSSYATSRVANLSSRPNLIFVDGHCKTPLEEMWEALFSSVKYAKNFSTSVCFSHLIFAPLGYETALFKGLTESIRCQGTSAQDLQANPDDRKTSRLSEFGEMLTAAFDLPIRDLPVKSISSHNVLFVRREDYVAHPRHSGKIESRLSNEQEVFDAIKNWSAGQKKCQINVVNGLFAHMSLKEQLNAIREASVVIGAHGAGLTHLVAASKNTIVLEIISSNYRRPHFSLISEWKGLEYHAINLAGSYARPSVVIDELSTIMTSLGC